MSTGATDHDHEGAQMSEQQPQAAAPAYPGGAYLGQHQGNAIYEARLKRHTGMLLMSQTRTLTVRGTLEQVQAAYRSAQTHNLLAGWWGVISLFILNPVALIGNAHQWTRVKRAAGDLAAHRG
jgi:hypothetical protein